MDSLMTHFRSALFPRERRTGKEVPERARANLKKKDGPLRRNGQENTVPGSDSTGTIGIYVFELSDAQFVGF
jgi:hypothetical protein